MPCTQCQRYDEADRRLVAELEILRQQAGDEPHQNPPVLTKAGLTARLAALCDRRERREHWLCQQQQLAQLESDLEDEDLGGCWASWMLVLRSRAHKWAAEQPV